MASGVEGTIISLGVYFALVQFFFLLREWREMKRTSSITPTGWTGSVLLTIVLFVSSLYAFYLMFVMSSLFARGSTSFGMIILEMIWVLEMMRTSRIRYN
jgi:hypothetical protein